MPNRATLGRLPSPLQWREAGHGFVVECYGSCERAQFSLPPHPMHWLAIPLQGSEIQMCAAVGKARMQLNGHLSADSVFFVPAYMPSSWDYASSHGCLHVLLSDEIILAALKRRGLAPSRLSDLFPLLATPVPALAACLRQLGTLHAKPAGNGPALAAATADALVEYCFGLENGSHAERQLPVHLFAKVSALVHARFKDGVSLEEMAAVAKMNPFTLSRKFKLGIGRSPYEYVSWVRACHMRAQLCVPPETRLPMIEIAYQAGFIDQSHMIRMFRKMLGCTPGEYVRVCGGLGNAGQAQVKLDAAGAKAGRSRRVAQA